MEHAKGWVRAGHKVTWLTASYQGAKKESTVEGVGFVRRWGSLTVYLYAPMYLLMNAKFFDVIVDEVHGFPFFSPLFTPKPVVVFIHEIAGEIWDFMFPFPKNIIGKFLEHFYFRLYRHCQFWTDAPSTIDELVASGIPRSQCSAIPCPVVIDQRLMIKDTMKNHSSFIIHHSSKEEKPTYIFVSRVVRMKGVEEVIKAFSFIARGKSEATLWIVGGGEDAYLSELKQMIREYRVERQVKFFGVVTEKTKYNLMARAHILLHASVKEGWGLVVLEAASVGTPAVVYNVAGLKDVVKNNITGVVISNNSPAEMAEEAMRLQQDVVRYRQYQKKGKEWVRSLKWENVIRQSISLLQQAI